MIRVLVLQIEEQLGWGSGQDWSNKDFEALSEQIFKATKKRLSVTTLKRIWGRAEMVANPSMATLDILSEYMGHTDWRDFTKASNVTIKPPRLSFSKKRAKQLLVLGSALCMALLVWFYVFPTQENKKMAPMDVSQFGFKGNVVSKGIPNSVIFEYDASLAQPNATIEIQQDWDDRKRISVNKMDSIATCIYYRPGFFKSKLVVDGTIVKEDDVFIGTEGWLGTINKDSIPIYLSKNEISNGEHLGIDLSTLSTYQIDPKITDITTSLYYITDFPEVYTDDFEVSMGVKNHLDQTFGGCQGIEIFILYDGGAIGIPLAKKGCISNLDLFAFDQYVDGKNNDLSTFGVSFDNYVELTCTANKETLKIKVNGSLVYEFPIGDNSHSIKGVSVHFEGVGSVKDVSVKKGDGELFVLAPS